MEGHDGNVGVPTQGLLHKHCSGIDIDLKYNKACIPRNCRDENVGVPTQGLLQEYRSDKDFVSGLEKLRRQQKVQVGFIAKVINGR